jgi:hypothetical protein
MELDPSNRISVPEFAKLAGVTKSAISRAIAQGRLKQSVFKKANGHYEIDPKVGMIEFTTRRRRTSAGTRLDPEPPTGSVIDSEQKLKHFQAELARVKFEQQSGKLLDAEKVKSEAYKIARIVRDGVLGIPARLSSELAGMTDPFEIEQLLDRELSTALKNLSKEIEFHTDEVDA